MVVAGGVAAADADQSLGGGDGDAVSGRAGEFAEGAPGGGGVVEDVDGVVPDFGAAFPGFFIGEIGSACDDEAVAVKAGEGRCESDGIWEIGQLVPVCGRESEGRGGEEESGEALHRWGTTVASGGIWRSTGGGFV